ncbi:DUF2851 family protein [Nibricoccus sp. IMCC34717]|uniref:DUF2851 family protein n=1 Tax=Nibricoccus sp. IMCC34717 TaxID=3034021 RepID=UPI0038515C94
MANRVEEMQGVDGPFGLSELVVQGLWARGELLREGLRTECGRGVVIRRAGRWNHGAGPDFVGAELAMAGQVLTGDVEVHLRLEDWDQHGHAHDPAYGDVVLHVVLLPPKRRAVTRGWGGAEIPTLVLLPFLTQDLELSAIDDALGRALPEGAVPGAPVAPERIMRAGWRRWDDKVARARARLERWGWETAVHVATLEVLGHRANRAPMVALALRLPVDFWNWEGAEANFAEWKDVVAGWTTLAVRPPNQPAVRLRQYARWCRACPEWRTHLAQLPMLPLPEAGETAEGWRARADWGRWERRAAALLADNAVPAGRWRTWLLDAALPLLAAGGFWRAEEAGQCWWAAPVAELGPPVDSANGCDCNGVAQGLCALQRAEHTTGEIRGWGGLTTQECGE